jgi:hypothetical protein
VLAWTENEVACSMNSAESLMKLLPTGFVGKTSLALSPATKERTSPLYSEDSQGTPQLFPSKDGATQASASDQSVSQFGGCLTLKTSESHSDAVACSLSQALEPWRDELLEFCLSSKAVTGILRRSVNRKMKLDSELKAVLEQQAQAA